MMHNIKLNATIAVVKEVNSNYIEIEILNEELTIATLTFYSQNIFSSQALRMIDNLLKDYGLKDSQIENVIEEINEFDLLIK